jgi:capsular polysaccharide biosynthesis protein
MNGETEIDLRILIKVLRKRAWVIGLTLGLAIATAGALSLFVLPPVYEAEVTLMATGLEDRALRTATPTLEAAVDPLARLPQMTLNTYIAQLTSPRLLDQVARDLGWDATVWTPAVLSGMIRAEVPRDTNLIEVRVQSPDPVVARSLADALTQQFLSFISETNRQQLERSVEFLAEQSVAVRADRDRVAADLQRLQAAPGAAALLTDRARANSSMLASYRSDLLRARVEAAVARSAWARLEQQLAEVPAVLVSEEVTETKEVGVGVDGSGVTYQPRVVSRRETLNPVHLQLLELRHEKAVEVAERDARAVALTSLVAELERSMTDVNAQLNIQAARESALAQELDRLEATYRLLSERITETQIVTSLDLGRMDIWVFSPATTPRSPVGPRVGLNMAIAGMLGLMAGLGLVFVVEYLDNTIKNPEDVVAATGLPVLGQIPRFRPGGASLRRWVLGQP